MTEKIEKEESGRKEEINKTGQIGGFGMKGFTVTGWEGCFLSPTHPPM